MHIIKREATARLRCGLASEKDLEFLGVDTVKSIKGDPDEVQYRFGEHGVRAVKDEEIEDSAESRTFEHDASTEHVDSMGDIIKVAGWDTKRLRAGGVISLQWAHDYETAPMGKVLSAKRGVAADGTKALVTTSRFHEQSLYADSVWAKHCQTILNLVRSGNLPGVSVGFAPRDYKWPEPEEREALGMGPYGVIFEATELLELSVTPVPANGKANLKKSLTQYQAALAKLVEAKQITQGDMDDLLGELAISQDAWAERMAAAAPRAIIAMRSVPRWMAGAKSSPAPTSIDVEALSDAIARGVTKRLSACVSQVSREIVEPSEDAITASVERLEAATAALERAAKHTNDRVEVPPVSEPNGSAGENEEAGDGAKPSAIRALEALVNAAP